VRARAIAQASAYQKSHPDETRERNRLYYERNGDAIRAQARAWQLANHGRHIANILWRTHRLTPEDRAELYQVQEGRCYLCGEVMAIDEAFVEHDHACCRTGFSCPVCRRGLAHPNCNTSIGLAGDDPDRLRRMADALELAKRGVAERMAAADTQLTLELEA
jgi:hypothetical protein